MIWAALVVGVLAGILFVISLDAISLGPVHRSFDELEKANAELQKEVTTLREAVEAFGAMSISCPECFARFALSAGQGVADASGCEQHDTD